MTELYAALIAAGISIITTGAAFVVTWIRTKAMRAEVDSVKETIANSKQLYAVICPNCGHKIYLNNVSISTEVKENAAD